MADDLEHVDNRTPILVGCGQITDLTSEPSSARSPVAFVADAARLALADAGATGGPESLARHIDAVATMEFFSESSPRFVLPYGRSNNPPQSVAKRLGAQPRQLIYTHVGGNMPQYLINRFAEEISLGETRMALIAGGERMRSSQLAQRRGLALDWAEEPGGEPTRAGDQRLGWSPEEDRHGLMAAIYFYPLLETAIRGGLGRDREVHLRAMGRLFARLAKVAHDNPLAARRDGFSAEQLSTIDAANRWICYPYPKLMNSNAFVDQAAAVLLTSVGRAKALGIPRDRWVFLHGCADGADVWTVSERARLDASPAIRACAATALDMAGKQVGDIAAFDLYSCFPSAVEVALKEIGLGEDDPRGFSITGGLPYFGGPGNNYVTHSVAEMMKVVRRQPGAFGMVTANGSYLTKHSAGIYSTAPFRGAWNRPAPGKLQAELDREPKLTVNTAPNGPSRVETYAVDFAKGAPTKGFVIGRLTATGERFVANTPDDPTTLADLMARDQLGRQGQVSQAGGVNIFTPA